MKRFGLYLLTLLLAGTTLTASAQDYTVGQSGLQPVEAVPDEFVPDLVTDSLTANSLAPMMTLPIVDIAALGFDGMSPWYNGLGGPSWRLHEGFNAQLGMSLTVGFGKGAPKGVGFGQSAAFAYALPLSERFSAAVGVYANNMDWGGFKQTEGGVAAAFQYRLSDVVSLYAYGAKSFLPRDRKASLFSPFPLYLNTPKDRIGAMAEIKMGKNAMIQVSVERQGY